jgi:hypothetical protein
MDDVALQDAPTATGLLDDYLSEDELAAELKKTTRTVRNWARRKTGPPATYIGKTPYYRRETVRAWIVGSEGRGRLTRPLGRPPGRPRRSAG